MNKNIISLVDVSKTFNQGRADEYTGINKINLNLELGKIHALHGPSGSGKTTLLTLIGALARPTSGRIFIDEEDISSLPEKFLGEIRRQKIGFIFQQFNLIRGLSSLDNVILPAFPLGVNRNELINRAYKLFDILNITQRAKTKVEKLSGGEQQRVAIARALINQPQILIADEPTANLDSKLAQIFLEIIRQINKNGTTIILSTHDPLVLDSKIINTVVHLRDGKIISR